MMLNWLDFVLLAILLASAIMSARKGFSREIVGLAAALFAFVLGMWFYGLAGSFIAPYTGSVRVANLLGFLLVVFAVLLCGGILGWIVSRSCAPSACRFSIVSSALRSASCGDC